MNTYHNFQHALDVFQATYFFLFTAGMVPPVSILLHADARLWQPDKPTSSTVPSFLNYLENEDIFALYIAAVGHDVGHPGLTNAFLVRLPYCASHSMFTLSHSATPKHRWRRLSKSPLSSRCIRALSCNSCDTTALGTSSTVPSPARALGNCSR